MQRWIPSLIATVALAGFAGLCQAQTIGPITFTSGMPASFYDGANPAGDEVFSLAPGAGPTGDQCLQATFGADATTVQVIPAFNLSFATANYVQVEFDLKVQSGSAQSGTGNSAGYGNMQVGLSDASYNWLDGIGYQSLLPPAPNSWHHYVITFPAKDLNLSVAHVQIMLQAGNNAYNGNGTLGGGPDEVEIYLDNVQITALANPFILDNFSSDTSGNYNEESWTGVTEASSWNNTITDGAGSLGSLEINDELPVAAQWAAWAQSWVEWTIRTDPNRFTYFEFDLQVDPSSTAYSDGNYGSLTLSIRDASYANYNCSPGSLSIDPSYIGTWKHVIFTLPTTGDGGNPITNSPGYDLEFTGNYMGSVIYYIDNIELVNPVSYPKLEAILPGTPGGLKIALDADGTANVNDQEGICTPAADSNAKNFFWVNQTPATYSFFITNFPAPATAPGFDAHIYVVNGDTLTAVENDYGYNQTYSGVNWNAGDMISMDIQNGTAGGVQAQFEWKTNLFNSNPSNYDIVTFTYPSMASANGTWALNFTDNTHGNLTGPDNIAHSFTVPDVSSDPNNNFSPSTSMIGFGVFKNGNAVNNSQSCIFQNVTTILGGSPVYNDSFNGPGLTANYAWQVAEYYQDGANRTSWSPYGTAFWVEYGLPNAGYSVQSVGDLSGTWGSAGISYTYADSTGTNYFGAVPTASLPAGNAGFFRLMHP